MSSFDAPKLVTLTLAASSADLADTLRRLHSAMRDLRRRKFWAERVTGGVWSIEVTRGTKGTHWHVHAHLLIDAEYMPQSVLSDEWRAVTGDSYIVDIRSATSREKAAFYVAKYITKPKAVSAWRPEEIREFADAMKGVRVLQTFGSAHGVPVDPSDANEPLSHARCRVPLDELADEATAHNPHAIVIINCLRTLGHGAWRLIERAGAAPLLPYVDLVNDPAASLVEAMEAFTEAPPPGDGHGSLTEPDVPHVGQTLHLWPTRDGPEPRCTTVH